MGTELEHAENATHVDIGIPENAYGYIYMNYYIDTDMWYIGRHQSTHFDWNYLGSGTIPLKLRKCGVIDDNNICSMVLDWCLNEDELNEREYYWTTYFSAVRSTKFYNIVDGGNYQGKSNPKSVGVRCVELELNFNSIREACRFIKRNYTTISKALNSGNTCGGYHWVYLNEDRHNTLCRNTYRDGFKNYSGKGKLVSKETRSLISKNVKESSKYIVKNPVHAKWSDEAKKRHSIRMKEVRKEHPLSEEHLRILRDASRRKKMSNEARKKISERMSGENNPNYGKPRSDETKIKIGESRKGKVHSVESKKKMSDFHKKWASENHDFLMKISRDGCQKTSKGVFCREIDVSFKSMREACRYFKENYHININRGLLRKHLNGELEYYLKVNIHNVLTKLTWVEV